MSALARRIDVVALCIAALCGGCTGLNLSRNPPLVPVDEINVSRTLSIPLEAIAAGALLYVIIDPLAPNWQIEESKLDGGRYLIAMKKKRFTTGGDGEAAQIFYRRAAQLARENNGAYRVVSYSEGIESYVLIAQRVAQGVVEVTAR